MKLVVCFECSDYFSPGIDEPKACKCGYTCAVWDDPAAGKLRVSSRLESGHLRIVGLMNGLLLASAAPKAMSDEQWRTTVEGMLDAPGYLFDRSRRNCPVVMLRVGESNDVVYDPDLIKKIPWLVEDRLAAARSALSAVEALARQRGRHELLAAPEPEIDWRRGSALRIEGTYVHRYFGLENQPRRELVKVEIAAGEIWVKSVITRNLRQTTEDDLYYGPIPHEDVHDDHH